MSASPPKRSVRSPKRRRRIAVVGAVEPAAPVAIQQVSPAQHEVLRITAAAEVYRVRQQFTLSTQAYKAAADLQVIIWRL